MTSCRASYRSHLSFGLLAAGTVLGLSGTDLLLPAIPELPEELAGTPNGAQHVIAEFVAGTALGLLVFGSMGPRFGRTRTLIAALCYRWRAHPVAPFVMVQSLHGSMGQFITMQVVGVGGFIVSANLTSSLVQRFGSEMVIMAGTLLSAVSAMLISIYAFDGGHDPSRLICLFLPMNMGLGLRGPPGFLQALRAGDGDDERAASLTIIFIMAVAALGTALLAPFIRHGLIPLAIAAAVSQLLAVTSLVLLPCSRSHG